MRAAAIIHAHQCRGATQLNTLRSDPPLVLRQTAGAVYLLGGAAGPLGGDELTLCATVGDAASLRVHSAAASLAQPGAHGQSSSLRTTLTVGEHANLVWLPEPLISVEGSDHYAETVIEVTDSSRVTWTEEFVLGRHLEPSGVVRSMLRIRRNGADIVHHQNTLGSLAASAAVIGDARVVVNRLVVGPDAPTDATSTVDHRAAAYAAWFPLADGVAMLVALALDLDSARRCAGELTTATAWADDWPSR